MNISPKISVGVPAYNQGCYLRQTLNSLLNQSVPPVEIVVSNNHSTDDTGDILNEFQDRVRIVQPERHVGMMQNWNFVASHLTGDWFTLLSSDDVAKPHFVETLLQGTRKSGNAVLVRSGWENIDAVGNIIEKRPLLSVKEITSPPQTFYEQLIGPKVSFAAFAIKKDAWEEVGGFPEECHYYGDWAMWLNLALKGDFVHEKGLITQYRMDYRPNINRERIIRSLKDELSISRDVIPSVAEKFAGIHFGRIDTARKSRFLNSLVNTSQVMGTLDEIERMEITNNFVSWADAIGIDLENLDAWRKFNAGEIIETRNLMIGLKVWARKRYIGLRRF